MNVNENPSFVENIKTMVSKKLNVMINIIFSRDEKKWQESLKIVDVSEENTEHYKELVSIIDELIIAEENSKVSEESIEKFSEKLLLTPELNIQISKLLLKKA